MKTITPSRPLIRYHGSKWMLAPWIISHFPKHRIYTEAFGGGGSILLRKSRAYAEVYNDLDADIVNLFKIIRDKRQQLREALELTPFSRKEFEHAYCYTNDDFEAARRTVVRAFMGFGSAAATKTTYDKSIKGVRSKKNYNGRHGKPCTGFRANSHRSGTTPAMDWRNYPHVLDATINPLQGVIIECRDYQKIMNQHDSMRTLHYCDPPYVKDTRYNGQSTSEYRHEMSNEDHKKFITFARSLKGMVIISGYENEIYDTPLTDWRKEYRTTFADGAKKRREVLWISPNVPQKQKELF